MTGRSGVTYDNGGLVLDFPGNTLPASTATFPFGLRGQFRQLATDTSTQPAAKAVVLANYSRAFIDAYDPNNPYRYVTFALLRRTASPQSVAYAFGTETASSGLPMATKAYSLLIRMNFDGDVDAQSYTDGLGTLSYSPDGSIGINMDIATAYNEVGGFFQKTFSIGAGAASFEQELTGQGNATGAKIIGGFFGPKAEEVAFSFCFSRASGTPVCGVAVGR